MTEKRHEESELGSGGRMGESCQAAETELQTADSTAAQATEAATQRTTETSVQAAKNSSQTEDGTAAQVTGAATQRATETSPKAAEGAVAQLAGTAAKEEIGKSIEEDFESIYREFRLQLYRRIFSIVGERPGSLSATEFFAAEVIYLLKNPTISQFAEYLKISSPNAAYKIRSLVEKGYITKAQTDDKRSYRVRVKEKFTQYYHDSDSYGSFIFSRLRQRLNEEELRQVDGIFRRFLDQIAIEKEAGNV